MRPLRWIVWKITLAYLSRQLGRKNLHSFSTLQGPWNTGSDSVSLGIMDATWEVQDRLIKEFGYHECPSCKWATENPREHLTVGSWCWEQYQETHSRRFYILEKKLEREGCFDQIGILSAESLGHAAYKLRANIVSIVRPPESAVACAELENNYWLIEIEEVTSLPFLTGE
jgi:hypothetical protein